MLLTCEKFTNPLKYHAQCAAKFSSAKTDWEVICDVMKVCRVLFYKPEKDHHGLKLFLWYNLRCRNFYFPSTSFGLYYLSMAVWHSWAQTRIPIQIQRDYPLANNCTMSKLHIAQEQIPIPILISQYRNRILIGIGIRICVRNVNEP